MKIKLKETNKDELTWQPNRVYVGEFQNQLSLFFVPNLAMISNDTVIMSLNLQGSLINRAGHGYYLDHVKLIRDVTESLVIEEKEVEEESVILEKSNVGAVEIHSKNGAFEDCTFYTPNAKADKIHGLINGLKEGDMLKITKLKK